MAKILIEDGSKIFGFKQDDVIVPGDSEGDIVLVPMRVQDAEDLCLHLDELLTENEFEFGQSQEWEFLWEMYADINLAIALGEGRASQVVVEVCDASNEGT